MFPPSRVLVFYSAVFTHTTKAQMYISTHTRMYIFTYIISLINYIIICNRLQLNVDKSSQTLLGTTTPQAESASAVAFFHCKQPLLFVQSACVSRQTSANSHHPVAWHDKQQSIVCHRAADSLCRNTPSRFRFNLLCDFPVCKHLTERYIANDFPNPLPKRRLTVNLRQRSKSRIFSAKIPV